MASSRQIKISITSALNAAGIEATKQQVDAMASSVKKSMADAASSNRKHWADIKAAWDMGLAAIRTVGGLIQSALKKAFDAEYALTNFKTMLGSLEAAKQHVAELKQFAAQTPLTFGDLAGASKTLLAFGADVKQVMPSLKMLGDISLGNAEKFQSLSLAFGKVQSEGKLTGVTLKQMIIAGFNPLQEIAAKTGATMDELKKQMEGGSITFDLVKAAMKSATSEGGRFNNAMKDASQTGAGLVSTLQDNWTAAVTKFGGAFSEAAKGGIAAMIAKIQELNRDGTIDVWADKVAAACEKVVGAVRVAAEWGGKLKTVWNWVKDQIQASAAYWGTLAGGGNLNQANANFAKVREGNKLQRINDADREATIRAEAAKKAAREEAAARQKEAEKTASVQELYEQQKAKAREEADRKAAEKAAAARAKLDAQEAARRERERQKELAAKIRDHQKFLSEAKSAENAARNSVNAANSKLQQAWGWYRDKDSMAAQIAEEKADAAARKQYEKDFRRLRDRRRDWRTAENLSVDDEAVRRVALAREEKEKAEKALAEIEKNTRDLAEKVEQLLSMKGGD